jgi:hypothetical protein
LCRQLGVAELGTSTSPTTSTSLTFLRH